MKKKLVVFSLVLALVAIAVGGTLAYFMDEDEVTNTFTIGSVEVEQIEQQRVDQTKAFTEAGNLETFENDKQLIPVIRNESPTDDPNFQDKYVTVKNLGKNDAYVQVFVAVPKVLADANVLLIHSSSLDWTKDNTTWTVKEKDIDENSTSEMEYIVYKYMCSPILTAKAEGAETYPVTTPAIEGVYISQYADMDVTYKEDGSIEKAEFEMNGAAVTGFDATKQINVYVATQAIQARGFADANTALANFGTHPWVTTP